MVWIDMEVWAGDMVVDLGNEGGAEVWVEDVIVVWVDTVADLWVIDMVFWVKGVGFLV